MMIFQRVVSLFSIIFVLSLPNQSTIPNPCLDISDSISDFIACQLSKYIPKDALESIESYNARLPDPTYTSMIDLMLESPCPVEAPLTDLLTVHIIKESGVSYCLLSERYIRNGMFLKGWAIFATKSSHPSHKYNINTDQADSIPNRKATQMHIQSPHPYTDFQTAQLSTILFVSSPHLQTLLLATRHRNASPFISPCISPTLHSLNSLSDPCHSPLESFHIAAKRVHTKNKNAVFLQLHVKAVESCEEDMFVSAGVGYVEEGWAVQRFVDAAKRVGKWRIGDPSSSRCVLRATKNVLGRVVNGFNECDGMNVSTGTHLGNFIHVEQSTVVAFDDAFWIKLLDSYFTNELNTVYL